MPPNAIFRVFNSNLKVLREEANQSSTWGCGGCNPLESIDCYALKCTKVTLFAKISVLLCFYNNTSIFLYVLSWQGGGYSPLAPLNLPLRTASF